MWDMGREVADEMAEIRIHTKLPHQKADFHWRQEVLECLPTYYFQLISTNDVRLVHSHAENAEYLDNKAPA
jgi:hypothetical protein